MSLKNKVILLNAKSDICFKKQKLDLTQSVFAFILFLANPLIGLIFSLGCLLQQKKASEGTYFLFFILLSLFLAGINVTKVPSSDQLGYLRHFLMVPNKSFYYFIFDSLGTSGKDPFYNLVVYISYYITFGYPPLFFCILSFLIYIYHFLAIYKLFRMLNVGKGAIICGVMILAFFTQYFTLTNHLIRQMAAESVFIYAFIFRIIKGKNNWYLLAIAFLIHSSSALLILLSLCPFLYRKLSVAKVLLVLACFIPIFVFSKKIGLFFETFTNVDAINYAFNRLANNVSDVSDNISQLLILLVFIPLITIGIKKAFFEKPASVYILPIIHVFFILVLSVFSFHKNPLMQYRFFYYSYSFLPFLLPLAFSKKNKITSIYQTFIVLFFVIRFLLLYEDMVFNYAPLLEVLVMPFPYLLFHPYYGY